MLRAVLVLGLMAVTATASAAEDLRKAVVAGGCFWCVESDFDAIDGVSETISGYAGGTVADPTYKQVVAGKTGHYEVVEITYDADVLSYDALVRTFLRSVDPTDPGGQFCDRGDSYRTAIFVTSEQEEAIAREAIAEAEKVLGTKVVTEVLEGGPFYPAEGYHQDFYRKNPLRYETYRKGCRRDARVQALWGDQAIKTHGS